MFSTRPDSVLNAYPHAKLRYDEMFAPDASVRPHWQALLAQLQDTSVEQMAQKVSALERQVRENGVTYNVYADPQGTDRPWELDPLPMILPAQEWAQIESAVAQRASLLNQILLDIYGDQKLLAEGLMPASLVHGHSGFLRPCHGISHRTGVALHTYAVDLARSPDGTWWAVADRTQAPSGAGYALENRMVVSRAFPELFRDLRVQRLASFFATLRDSLAVWGRSCSAYQGKALAENERPLIVLLTPGPYNETYYEQAYLARYLGFPLVQGSDLTVREGFVWLKTLAGLQRVHVILRRLDDDYCDPLELKSDSALGVAGLTEAARRGSVLIANSLGSNLLESGALLGFLPRLCERLLGETLKMPSVATWWCGEPAALEDAVSKFSQLVFKPTYPQLRQAPVFGEDLNPEERAQFIARLRTQPDNFTAQEFVRISQVPVWRSAPDAGLGACAVGLRVFACASPNGYVVMPGGLTRIASGADARVIAMQRGGGSKDTWVLTEGRVHETTLLPRPTSAQELVRGDTQLASRTIENLFWFGRYTERCDHTARLLRRSFDSLISVTPERRHAEWATLVRLCQFQELLPESSNATDSDIESLLLKAMVSDTAPGLSNNVQHLFRVAFNLRERLSADNWRSLNQLLQKFGKIPEAPAIGEALLILDEAAVSLMTLTGFSLDGMTRDLGWRFLSIGRRIERLQFICTVVSHALTMERESNLDWFLELGDSIITYRSRYMARPEWLPVLDLLLLDPSNPRSVVFQLEGLVGYLRKVAALHGECGHETLEPLIGAFAQLDHANDLRPGPGRLKDLVDATYAASFKVSERLAARFFSYAGRVEAEKFRA